MKIEASVAAGALGLDAGVLGTDAEPPGLGASVVETGVSVEIAPSSGAATYRALLSVLAARALALENRLAAPQGPPGRGVP